MRKLIPLLALFVLVGCASVYTATVTITQVVDAAMKDWAQMSVDGKTSPAIDNSVTKAHDKYRAACGVAQTALIAYKASGDQTQYVAAMTAVRAAVDELFNIITPLLAPAEATKLKTDLSKASSI